MKPLALSAVILWSIIGTAYVLPAFYEWQITATVNDIEAQALESQSEIDHVRRYINSQSIHKAGYSWLATQTPLMLASMRLGLKPPMTCGYRTLALNELLNRLGYQTRMVKIYDGDGLGHVFSEVYLNSRWQIQDADYNFALPVSAYQMVVDGVPVELPEPLPQYLDHMRYDWSGRGDLSRPYN